MRRPKLLFLLVLSALLLTPAAWGDEGDNPEDEGAVRSFPDPRHRFRSRQRTRKAGKASDQADLLPAAVPASLGGEGPLNLTATSNVSSIEGVASMIEKGIKMEFEKDSKKIESEAGRNFNETVDKAEGQIETVVRISSKSSDSTVPGSSGSSALGSGGSSAAAGGGAATTAAAGGATTPGSGTKDTAAAEADRAGGAAQGAPGALPSSPAGEAKAPTPEESMHASKAVDRIIDSRDNEFVLSASKDAVASLTLDPQFIQDITFLMTSAAGMGVVFELIRQPVINGYLVAGAIVGPGGLQLIKELVQVETLAQLGVQLLLFGLGRELNLAKIRAVWGVAILGGSLQIGALMCMGGAVAALFGWPVQQGAFVGALVSMSSTSVVIKCLEATRMSGSVYGQITLGTLILQDCSVGLMFALMPVFGKGHDKDGSAATYTALVLMIKVLAKLCMAVMAAVAVARTVLPLALRALLRRSSNELIQLMLVAFCFISAWVGGELGLSEELGAFIAGAMLAMAEHAMAPTHSAAQAHGSSPVRRSSAAASPSPRHLVVNVGGGAGAAAAAGAAAVDVAPPGGVGGDGAAGGHHHSGLGARIESFENVLVSLFVASIGLIMSPTFLAQHVVVLTLGTLVVMVVKTAVVALVVHAFGVAWHTSFAVGITMAHIGEFAFVLLSMANHLKLLSPEVYMLLLGVTAMSLLTTPMVIMVSNNLLARDRPWKLLRSLSPSSSDSMLHVTLENGSHSASTLGGLLTDRGGKGGGADRDGGAGDRASDAHGEHGR